MDKDLKSISRGELRELCAAAGGKAFQGDYLFSFIHQKGAGEIDAVTTLSKPLREALKEQGYFISSLKVIDTRQDTDGTIKFLLECTDGVRFESVIMQDGDRRTVCVSSQSGCRMGCLFCATARLGFERNLTAGEIADQVILAGSKFGRISNVVYMGMGEPFDSYDAVLKSVRLLMDEKGLNIGQRHITLSTVGLPEGIRRLAAEDLQVRLALSLHSAVEQVRRKMVPAANRYPLDEVIAALREYQQATGRRITVECCMIAGVNDSERDAHALAGLLRGLHFHVNLIEFNPHAGCAYEPASHNQMHRFADVLKAKGIETVIRYRRGQGIKAACGQLGAEQAAKRP